MGGCEFFFGLEFTFPVLVWRSKAFQAFLILSGIFLIFLIGGTNQILIFINIFF